MREKRDRHRKGTYISSLYCGYPWFRPTMTTKMQNVVMLSKMEAELKKVTKI